MNGYRTIGLTNTPAREHRGTTEHWQGLANCRSADPDMFFHPDGERGDARRHRNLLAKQICTSCPVKGDCLDLALASREGFGIWGGMSEDERAAVLLGANMRPRGRGVHVDRI
ncbi:WhiB family transcriptional regulator [Mycobacterium sp. NPDC050441]|uniref:WhiB family transcriptional regulator n=1 Tax=Mycobacterium sp. NPDC050441 TaxID=3155403 RepID=UPI00340E4EBC